MGQKALPRGSGRRQEPRCRSRAQNSGTQTCKEAGSYLRLIDSCITQLEAQGPRRTCDESKTEEVTNLRPTQVVFTQQERFELARHSPQACQRITVSGKVWASKQLRASEQSRDYRGTSLMRNRPSLTFYSGFMSRALWWSWGGGGSL